MSDLLIKGIGMPKPGKPIMLMVTSEGNVFANMVGELSFTEIKAFELPPHGRLVDENNLLKEQLTLIDGSYKTSAVRVVDICNSPTIIPADSKNIPDAIKERWAGIYFDALQTIIPASEE